MLKKLVIAAAFTVLSQTAAAQGSMFYTGEIVDLGNGFGSQSVIVTFKGKGNSTTEGGCVGWGNSTTNCGVADNGVSLGPSQGSFRSFSEFVNLQGSTFRLILNGNEPGSAGDLNILSLNLRLWADATTFVQFDLIEDDKGTYTGGQGLGALGLVFGISQSSWGLFDNFIAANPNGGLGAGGTFSDIAGGPEYLAATIVTTQQVPEPASLGLIVAGLAGLGVAARRRKA